MNTKLRAVTTTATLGVALLLVACGGGGRKVHETPDVQSVAVQRAEDAATVAEAAARDAQAACGAAAAACAAARDAREAASRADAALQASRAATTAQEAERAAGMAERASDDATTAAQNAARLAQAHAAEPEPTPVDGFTLEAGTERQLAPGTFLVCPVGGASCEVESVTETEDGGIHVELAATSAGAFLWERDTGLYTSALTGFDHVRVRLPGSNRIHVVTCAQSDPCDVTDLHFDNQNRIVWTGTAHLHVSQDETGFYLTGERTVTFPDGQRALISCPNGCGIDRLYVEDGDNYGWSFDSRFEEPEVQLLGDDEGEFDGGEEDSGDEPGTGVEDGDEPGTGDEDGTASMPSESTPPVHTASYSRLPAQLTDFLPTHWELSDEYVWDIDPQTGHLERRPMPEVECPGTQSMSRICKVRGQNRNVDEVLAEMDGNIVVLGPRDRYGYANFGPDLARQQAILLKIATNQPVTQAEEDVVNYQTVGQWGAYSAFGRLSLRQPANAEPASPDPSHHWFAFGDLYGSDRGGKPTAAQGGATWRGPMSGSWGRVNSRDGSVMGGRAELVYDFTNDDLDLTLTIEHHAPSAFNVRYAGPTTISWVNVKQNGDGSFFISGNHETGTTADSPLGILDGDFYGPKADEVAGYFERTMGQYDLSGVFGGKRQMGSSP